MGCCSPNYRKTVNEQEDIINRKGTDKLALSIKLSLIVITLVAALAAIML
jgi:hypothetical protein